jgi:hypothetical protein
MSLRLAVRRRQPEAGPGHDGGPPAVTGHEGPATAGVSAHRLVQPEQLLCQVNQFLGYVGLAAVALDQPRVPGMAKS